MRDRALTFAHLTSAIRQAITLEARIAGDSFGPAAARPAPPYDPRPAKIRLALHQAVENQPNSTSLQRQLDEVLEDQLPADTEKTATISNLFAAICDELGIEPDITSVSDGLLEQLCTPEYLRQFERSQMAQATDPPDPFGPD